MRRLADRFEPGIEWLIRLSGWSAIFFVLCIFIFIFKEGGPYLWNELTYEAVEKEYSASADAPPVVLPAIKLTELPYEVVEERLLEDLSEAGAEGRIAGFRDVRLEIGDRVEVVVYLEPGTDPEKGLAQILAAHPLRQDSSHIAEFFTGKEWKPESEKVRHFG